MDLGLTGKRALVTGGSRGIGLAVARALAAEGADVAILSRSEEDLRRAADQLLAGGATGRVMAVTGDTSDDASVQRAVTMVEDELGGVDVAVNAAARPASSGPRTTALGTGDQAVRDELETKLLGYLRVARAVAPGMVDRGWGRIVNVSGLNARRTGSIPGSVRNVAVAALTKNLADELGPLGVNVTVVHPGMTRTERTPGMVASIAERDGSSSEEAEATLASGVSIGRLATAAEVADVVAFLASPRSVALNGDPVLASGGTIGPIYY